MSFFKSVTRSRKSVTRSRKSVTRSRKSTTRSRKSTTRSRKSTTRSRKSTTRSRKSTTRSRKSVTRSRKSTTRSRKSTTRSRKSTTRSQLEKPIIKKYAIVSLLMMGDDYLPGILMVGKSIKNLMREEEKNNIDMVCLVTPDISKNARHDILKYYDKVIEIPYIEIPYQNIKHTNVEMQKIYSKTFTKLYTLTLVEYDKIVMIDADMIVLRHDFFSLFDIPAPAGIFLGNLSAFKPNIRSLYEKIYKKYLKHGEIIPNEAYKITCNDIRKKFNYKGNCAYLGVETSICLLKPSLEDFNYLKNIILKAPPKTYKSDTDLISRYFEGKWRHLDLLYLGRWIYPPTQKEYIILDLYGMEGKPWQLKKIDKIYKEYPDIKYWVDQYLIEYDKSFKESCISPQLEKLWLYLQKLKKSNP